MNTCPHCDAPLKPAATYCLACDRPVVDETSRLSVGEAVPVSVGRPLVGLAVLTGTLIVLGLLVWGGYAFFHHASAGPKAQALRDVKRGTMLLVDAESGTSTACHRSTAVLTSHSPGVLRECQAIVNHDPGARVASIRVDRLALQGTTGTAHVRAVVDDRTGTHTLDRVVDLERVRRVWRMSWDGRPEI